MTHQPAADDRGTDHGRRKVDGSAGRVAAVDVQDLAGDESDACDARNISGPTKSLRLAETADRDATQHRPPARAGPAPSSAYIHAVSADRNTVGADRVDVDSRAGPIRTPASWSARRSRPSTGNRRCSRRMTEPPARRGDQDDLATVGPLDHPAGRLSGRRARYHGRWRPSRSASRQPGLHDRSRCLVDARGGDQNVDPPCAPDRGVRPSRRRLRRNLVASRPVRRCRATFVATPTRSPRARPHRHLRASARPGGGQRTRCRAAQCAGRARDQRRPP